MIRSLKDIEKDIQDAKDTIAELNGEIHEFQSKCPHSEDFLEVKTKDYEDERGGPGIYIYSAVKYTCKLCGGTFHGEYDKKKEAVPTLYDLLGVGE